MKTLAAVLTLVAFTARAQLVTSDVPALDAGTDDQILAPLFVDCPAVDPNGVVQSDGGWTLSDQQARHQACRMAALQTRTLQLERTPPEWKFNWTFVTAATLVTVFLFGGLVGGWELRQLWMTATGR